MPVLDDSDYGFAAQDLLSIPRSALAQMSMSEIVPLREGAKTKAEHNYVAPYEHRAYVREVMQDNPKHAVGMAAAIPAYSAAKALGIVKTRSSASAEEITQGYAGLTEGLVRRLLRQDEKPGPTRRGGIDGSFPTGPAQRRIRHGGGGVRG